MGVIPRPRCESKGRADRGVMLHLERLIHRHCSNSDMQGQGIRTSCQHTLGISTTIPSVYDKLIPTVLC